MSIAGLRQTLLHPLSGRDEDDFDVEQDARDSYNRRMQSDLSNEDLAAMLRPLANGAPVVHRR